MKAKFITNWTIDTIKLSLFVTTNDQTLKGSITWKRANELLNWLKEFDNESDMIAISNKPIKFEDEEN